MSIFCRYSGIYVFEMQISLFMNLVIFTFDFQQIINTPLLIFFFFFFFFFFFMFDVKQLISILLINNMRCSLTNKRVLK